MSEFLKQRKAQFKKETGLDVPNESDGSNMQMWAFWNEKENYKEQIADLESQVTDLKKFLEPEVKPEDTREKRAKIVIHRLVGGCNTIWETRAVAEGASALKKAVWEEFLVSSNLGQAKRTYEFMTGIGDDGTRTFGDRASLIFIGAECQGLIYERDEGLILTDKGRAFLEAYEIMNEEFTPDQEPELIPTMGANSPTHAGCKTTCSYVHIIDNVYRVECGCGETLGMYIKG